MQTIENHIYRFIIAIKRQLYTFRLFLGIMFLFFISSINICYSQLVFTSDVVKNCYIKLPDICKNEIQQQLTLNPKSINLPLTCLAVSKSLPIHIINSSKGLIHVGFLIFKDSNTGFYPVEIYRFLERIILESEISDSKSFSNYLSESKISINTAGLNSLKSNHSLQNVINFLNPTTNFSLKYDSSKYFASWYDGINKLVVVFPAKNTLITGIDKKDLDDILYNDLKSLVSKAIKGTSTKFDNSDNYKKSIDNLFILSGQSYFQDISSDLYFSKSIDTSKYNLLFDKKYYVQSFSNLLLKPELIDKTVTVSVSQKQYGGIIKYLTIDYSSLVNYFVNSNYEVFVGIENKEADNLSATVIFFNKALNNLHLLYIKTDANTVFLDKPKFEATFYTNVPTDNIKNIFADYFDTEYQHNLKLK